MYHSNGTRLLSVRISGIFIAKRIFHSVDFHVLFLHEAKSGGCMVFGWRLITVISSGRLVYRNRQQQYCGCAEAEKFDNKLGRPFNKPVRMFVSEISVFTWMFCCVLNLFPVFSHLKILIVSNNRSFADLCRIRLFIFTVKNSVVVCCRKFLLDLFINDSFIKCSIIFIGLRTKILSLFYNLQSRKREYECFSQNFVAVKYPFQNSFIS